MHATFHYDLIQFALGGDPPPFLIVALGKTPSGRRIKGSRPAGRR
jgi:hypothetical protein